MMKSSKTSICLVLLVGFALLAPARALADPPPDTYDQAVASFPHRRDALVRAAITQFAEIEAGWEFEFDLSKWNKEEARRQLTFASAVIWALSHPSDFWNGADDAYDRLQFKAIGTHAWSSDNYRATLWIWHVKLLVFFDGIYYFAESKCKSQDHVGTNCDYDFVLVNLAHLIYTYAADTQLKDIAFDPDPANPWYVPHPDGPNVKWTYADFLTNDMIYNIICQRKGENLGRYCPGTVKYAFGELPDDRVFKQWVGVSQSETENHVLQIVAWDYLATNWVMWQGSLPFGSRRRFQPMTNLMNDHWFEWENKAESIYKRALKVVGRVVHSGMFETNSRPYGYHSLNALLALASYADPWDPGQPPHIPMPGPIGLDAVKKGAVNAVNYLATKYAFQSIRGKRQGPMRRNRDYRKRKDFYSSNGFVTTMSLLSGAYEWDDCIENTESPHPENRPDCPRLRWDTGPHTSAFAAMLGASEEVGGYQIPEIIHRFLFERRPFYARMMTRYTDEHQPRMKTPKYFVNYTKAFHSGENKSSPELYFGDGNILLSAGGSYTPYWDLGGGDMRLDRFTESNHIWAKPTMLIPRGDFGYIGDHKLWEWHAGKGLGHTEDDVLVSPGKVWNWWRSECNVWLYRNFVYGYRFHDRGPHDSRLAPEGFCDEDAFVVPDFWKTTAFEVREFKIGWAHFEIYDFKGNSSLVPPSAALPVQHTGAGYYIVRARFRKDKAAYLRYRKHREFARGFVEIIPRTMFNDAHHLEIVINDWNGPSNFPSDRDMPWVYVLTISKERVVMDQVMGAGVGGREHCSSGILGIQEFDWTNGWWGDWVDMSDQFIPPDITDSGAMKQLPLITVWQLKNYFEPTGCKYVETVDEGVIVVRRPADICWRWDWTHLPPVCKEIGPGWHCLKIDSRNYTQPDSEFLGFEGAQTNCSCFAP